MYKRAAFTVNKPKVHVNAKQMRDLRIIDRTNLVDDKRFVVVSMHASCFVLLSLARLLFVIAQS